MVKQPRACVNASCMSFRHNEVQAKNIAARTSQSVIVAGAWSFRTRAWHACALCDSKTPPNWRWDGCSCHSKWVTYAKTEWRKGTEGIMTPKTTATCLIKAAFIVTLSEYAYWRRRTSPWLRKPSSADGTVRGTLKEEESSLKQGPRILRDWLWQ